MNATVVERRAVIERGLRDSMRTSRLFAAGIAMALAAGSLVPIGGAVVASGAVDVEGKVRTVTHPSGGVLARLLVRDGQRVALGQPLLTLDDAVTSIGARSSAEDLASMLARRARLEAERDGAVTMTVPPELATRTDPAATSAIAREQRQLHLDRSEQAGQRAQLAERIRQTAHEISAMGIQAQAAHEQRRIVEPELAGLKAMWDKRLVSLNRYDQLRRDAVEMDSNAAALEARQAASRAQIAELRQSLLQVDQDARAKAGAELADISTRLGDARSRAASAGDVQRKTVVRAPADGVVDAIAFHTVGGVIPAGQTIMRIVPDRDTPDVEVKVQPADINQVHAGQRTSLRFTALNAQRTPQIDGRVAWVAADRSIDEKTGATWYAARISVSPEQLARLRSHTRQGMPVEAFIATEDRSILSYVTKPLHDQLSRVFQEGD